MAALPLRRGVRGGVRSRWSSSIVLEASTVLDGFAMEPAGEAVTDALVRQLRRPHL